MKKTWVYLSTAMLMNYGMCSDHYMDRSQFMKSSLQEQENMIISERNYLEYLETCYEVKELKEKARKSEQGVVEVAIEHSVGRANILAAKRGMSAVGKVLTSDQSPFMVLGEAIIGSDIPDDETLLRCLAYYNPWRVLIEAMEEVLS